jgi:ubiquinone biosynthesis protein UbiJ
MDLPSPLSFAVQQGIATVLRLDPHTKNALSEIDGKVIRINCTSPAVTMHLFVMDNEVDVAGTFDDEPDTTITGSATALLSLRYKTDALYKGDVTLSGDTATANKLRAILSGIDIDLEEVVAPITGDSVAHQLGRVGRQFSDWLGDTSTSLKQNTSEYLQEEVNILAPNSEIKRFCAEVEALREQTDRLDARMAILENKANKSS